LWRNSYAAEPVIAGTIAFGDAWNWTTERLSRGMHAVFEAKLPGALPSDAPIDAPELVAYLAQSIQLLADVGSPTCRVTSRDPSKKRAVVHFSCQDFTLGSHSASLAVQVVDWLVQSDKTPERLAALLQSCIEKAGEVGLQHPTLDMLETAIRRGIPWVRLSPHLRHVQLGHGHRQQRLWTTTLSAESALAEEYSKNKILTLDLLRQVRLPVGRYAIVRDVATARRSAQEIGYPVVLKPVDGGKGEAVFVDLRSDAELAATATAARIHERPHMIQNFFPGEDHRLLVVAGKLVAAVRKDTASITGDGHHTVAELVEIENRDPRRMSGRIMDCIPLDERSDRILARQGLTRGSVAERGRVVRVHGVANVSAGATTRDVMDVIHPDNARVAVRAARAIGLNVCGVDFVSPDISKSWHDVGGGICEVNASIGLRPHLQTAMQVDVRDVLLQTVFPPEDDGRIPTAIIAGTASKIGTSRMLANILSSASHVVGCATTEGVSIGMHLVERGDFANARGASIVLRDAVVTAAVLETTPEEIQKAGLCVDHCDVTALLNVTPEQSDTKTVERTVLDTARKAIVLNADDPRCLALATEFTAKLRTILFSRSPGSTASLDHRARGGDALFLANRDGRDTIVVASGSVETTLLAAAEIPATKSGSIELTMNAMAAAALAIGLGIDLDDIRAGLRRFGPGYAVPFCSQDKVALAQA
jgi:cyanophycin synthetase